MTLRAEVRERVRLRAGQACEFCGVHETDVGGELTIDHFQPKTKGGGDDLDNLLYCCIRCNQHKHDYWPAGSGDPGLWNPRREAADEHFLVLDDGTLRPLTPTGAFTLDRLRLNRSPLVAYRWRRRRDERREQLLRRYQDMNEVHEKLLEHQTELMERIWRLLEEQQQLLRRLLDDAGA